MTENNEKPTVHSLKEHFGTAILEGPGLSIEVSSEDGIVHVYTNNPVQVHAAKPVITSVEAEPAGDAPKFYDRSFSSETPPASPEPPQAERGIPPNGRVVSRRWVPGIGY